MPKHQTEIKILITASNLEDIYRLKTLFLESIESVMSQERDRYKKDNSVQVHLGLDEIITIN